MIHVENDRVMGSEDRILRGRSLLAGIILIALWLALFAVPKASAQGTAAGAMSAEQIVEMLKQNPDLLAAVKGAAAERLGVPADSITDDVIFERIRQDPELRARITADLEKRGHASATEAKKPEPAAPTATVAPPPLSENPVSAGSGVVQANEEMPVQRRLNPYAGLPCQAAPVTSENRTTAVQGAPPPQELIPCATLPSLQDLYSQVPASIGKLTRFGSETFRLGTGNASDLPMDLPVGPDYVLGPGDVLTLNIWGGQSDRLDRTIDRQGQIALPEAGTITITGMTIAQAQEAIQKALRTQFRSERVEISLGRMRTVRVYVVGDVQRPGAYDVSSLSTPLNAFYAAGGPTSRGSLRTLRHYRGKELVGEIDLYDLLLRGVRTDIERLQPGDTILVPTVGPQVAVGGMVRRPAIYELKGEQGLNEVIDLAGGVLVTANMKELTVERIEAHQRRTMLNVPLPVNQNEAAQKLAGFHVQDGDGVLVFPILPYNDQTVYLDGHVFRPGKFPYRDGMTINDLLRSYQDVLPEPAEHAEIIRLQPPDYRPVTIPVKLSEVLIGDDPITLQPFDVVRVFGRYEIDMPKVAIAGEVLRPGDYPLSQGMTIAALVRMAGGFKRSAYRDEADLATYVLQNGQKILTKHSVVAIEKAVNGDSAADVVLKPGDVLSIRQLTGWNDIGAAVTVEGEVGYAGTYGIQQGERLSSILKRTGGFREEAYPAGAVLERAQVKEIGEKSRLELIQRIQTTTISLPMSTTAGTEEATRLQAMQQQRQQILAELQSHPASGRLVVKISRDISKWENTPADIEVRAGDKLFIPKRPNFVTIIGLVYNSTAISYAPGKDASWYLNRAGGVTHSGDKKDIFVVRADGSVAAHGGGWMGGGALGLRMQPGDAIVVPEKIVGGSMLWKNLLGTAQIMSSVAITGAAARLF